MSLKGNKGLLIVYEHPVKRSFYQLTPLPLAQHWNSFFHVMSIVLMNYYCFTVQFYGLFFNVTVVVPVFKRWMALSVE